MRVSYSVDDLKNFERGIADDFLAKKIRAPIHLSGGNERQLIDVFERHVAPDDWICCTWRSHLHCLLKGVPPEKLRAAIHAGHSIALCFPEHRIISSAMVGGMAPIAVGLALGIKRKRETRRVFCFIGDMAWMTGIARESVAYARGWELPVTWVVEDNGLSTCTETRKVWGEGRVGPLWTGSWPGANGADTIYYQYINEWPHCGVGKHVDFGADHRTDGMG